MRIRTKIALMFTQLTFVVLLATFSSVYLITAGRSSAAFYRQLWERAMLIAQVEFSRSGMSDAVYQHLLDNSRAPLHGEQDYIFEALVPGAADSLRSVVPQERYVQQLLRGETVQFEEQGRQYAGIYYPGTVDHIVIVSAYDRQGAESLRRLLELLLIILTAGTALVFLIGAVYARRVMAPVRRIIDNVKRITANNLTHSLQEERGNDELSELSRTFNRMIDRLRTAFDMQNSFIRNASHELRNPLAAILGETELALNRPRTPEEYVQTLNTVLEETERLHHMMQDLLMLAQTDFDFSRIKKEKIDLAALLREIGDELARVYPGTRIEVVPGETNRPFEVTGALSILRLAFLNLIGNAVKFSDGKPVAVRLRRTRYGHVEVEILDRGIGIPPGELPHIVQPFYRAANTSGYKGTGIGLPLAGRIVELHEGHLTIDSQEGTGTKVVVLLDVN